MALAHLDEAGHARVVDVGDKEKTRRVAVARARVATTAETIAAIRDGTVPKGDVAAVVRVASITGAKRTSELIPLCHPLALTHVAVDVVLDPRGVIEIVVRAECVGRTGVEMEAMTGASVGALAAYDMIKGVDRTARVLSIELLEKSGGRSGHFVRERSRVMLVSHRLCVDDVLEAVARDQAGATVVFLGTVRDHAEGHAVTLLEYEAYGSMALAEMQRCVDEIEAGDVRLAVAHRTGPLHIGELAVVCAASAPHRQGAFVAARALIDAIKHRVPIWKREHGVEGPRWVDWKEQPS